MLAGHSAGQTPKYEPGELAISPIQAVFTGCPPGGPFPPTPPACATVYSVKVLHAPAGAKLRFDWYIELKLVDVEGRPDPGTPGSGADFDPTCTNAELPGGKVVEGAAGQSGVVYRWDGIESLTWYHGDAGVYQDNLSYGCDHSKMGPFGHQGIVTLMLDDVSQNATYPMWVCQANYYGTNTGVGLQEDTDCQPETSGPGERFLVAVAWKDEIIAERMAQSTHNQAGAKKELEHSLADLKEALAKEKSFPFADPYWVIRLKHAIQYDQEAIDSPTISTGPLSHLGHAIDDKDDLLDDADDDGYAPPPFPLPYPGK